MSSNMPQHDPVPGASHAPATAVERSQGTDPSAGYERRDASVRTILWLALAITATCALVLWGSLALRNHFESLARQNDPELSPLVDPNRLPPAPRLQDTPIRDYVEFRDSQEASLANYAWVDREQGVVQIPVERAIDLLVERGLPTPTGPGNPQQQLEENQHPESSQSDQPPPSEKNQPPAEESASPEPPPDRPEPENR